MDSGPERLRRILHSQVPTAWLRPLRPPRPSFGMAPALAIGLAVALLGSVEAFLACGWVADGGPTGSVNAFGSGVLFAWFIAAPLSAYCAWHAFGRAEDATWWKYALIAALVLLFVFELIVQGCTAATTPNASDPYCRRIVHTQCTRIAT